MMRSEPQSGTQKGGGRGGTAAEALASAASQKLLSETKGEVAGGSARNVRPGSDMYKPNRRNSRRICPCFLSQKISQLTEARSRLVILSFKSHF